MYLFYCMWSYVHMYILYPTEQIYTSLLTRFPTNQESGNLKCLLLSSPFVFLFSSCFLYSKPLLSHLSILWCKYKNNSSWANSPKEYVRHLSIFVKEKKKKKSSLQDRISVVLIGSLWMFPPSWSRGMNRYMYG